MQCLSEFASDRILLRRFELSKIQRLQARAGERLWKRVPKLSIIFIEILSNHLTKMVRACDENARREMASHNSLMDPTGKKEEGTT
jgi:hypothetical protein